MDDENVINGYEVEELSDSWEFHNQLKCSKIMMVDDEPIMMELVQAFLEEEGYQHFISFEDPSQALQAIDKEKPDLLLLDLVMPNIDGFQVLMHLRNQEEFTHLPIIILTSATDGENKLKALELGATDFLAKPVDSSELILRVRNTIAAKAHLDKLAFYDSLTGLPNRKLFFDRLRWALEQSKRNQQQLIVMNIGLERFRQINDTHGPSIGDALLVGVAERLMEVTRATDLVSYNPKADDWKGVARLSSEEFVLLIPMAISLDAANRIAKRIIQSLKQPFDLKGNEIAISVGIGIATFPDDGDQVELLLKHASRAKDFAMQKAENNFQFFSAEMNAFYNQRQAIEQKLRIALERQELQLFYQPKINPRNNQVLGVECLVRWFHPEDGMISPDVFIPVAEETGMIIQLGEWVLLEACEQACRWSQIGHQLNVAVNISSQQFIHPGFKETILDALEKSQLPPQQLVLEITESIMMKNTDSIIQLLHEIKAFGIKFSIDDFGTGYSSLSYLKKLPISELKVDRSFVLELPHNLEDTLIVKAIIAMSHSLNMSIVVEGVENQAQLDFLNQLNCDAIQGYYYSRPLNEDDFVAFLAKKRNKLSWKNMFG